MKNKIKTIELNKAFENSPLRPIQQLHGVLYDKNGDIILDADKTGLLITHCFNNFQEVVDALEQVMADCYEYGYPSNDTAKMAEKILKKVDRVQADFIPFSKPN